MEIPLLNADEENDLARRFRTTGDPEALGKLVRSHLRLVVSVARKHSRAKLQFDDLVSEGCLGLFEAAKRFDPDRGFRFSTYARWWVEFQISDFVRRTRSVVRTPSHLALGSSGPRAHPNRALEEDKQCDSFETALGRNAAEETWPSRGFDLSLNMPLEEGDGREVQDLLADPAESVETQMIEREESALNSRRIADALYVLTERERHVFVSRCLWERRLTLDQLSRTLKISRERVRQIEMAAWGKVRRALQERVLQAGGTPPNWLAGEAVQRASIERPLDRH
jgi:RNA polymerase sigma-32 factor